MNLSATTPIKYSQGRLLQNDVKQKPTQDAATDDGCCTCIFALGIVNTRVYNIADNLGNFGIFFTSQLAAYCASASVVLVPEHDSDSILNLLASSVAVVVWENIGRYVLLVIMLCSILSP